MENQQDDAPEQNWIVKVGSAVVRVAGKAMGFRHDSSHSKKHPHAGQTLPAPVIIEPGEPELDDEYGATAQERAFYSQRHEPPSRPRPDHAPVIVEPGEAKRGEEYDQEQDREELARELLEQWQRKERERRERERERERELEEHLEREREHAREHERNKRR